MRHAHDGAGVRDAAGRPVAVEARAIPRDDGCIAPAAGASARSWCPRPSPSGRVAAARFAAARRCAARRAARRAAACRAAARCCTASRAARRAASCCSSVDALLLDECHAARLGALRDGLLLGVQVPREDGADRGTIGVEAAWRPRGTPRPPAAPRDRHDSRSRRRPGRAPWRPGHSLRRPWSPGTGDGDGRTGLTTRQRTSAMTSRLIVCEAAGRPIEGRGGRDRRAHDFWGVCDEPRIGDRHERHDKGGGNSGRAGRLGGPVTACATSRGVARHATSGARAPAGLYQRPSHPWIYR